MTARSDSDRKWLSRLFALAGIVLIASPIAAYVWIFGPNVSSIHTRWAEFGSAIGGIYTPIAAALTLAVLIMQINLQASLNRHTFDYGYVQDARSDLHFFLDRLVKELEQDATENADMRTLVVSGFAWLAKEDLADPQKIQQAKAFDIRHPELMAMWGGINGVLAGLRVHDYPPYSNNYSVGKQKIMSLVSYPCCVAMDNFTHMVSEGRLLNAYEFSKLHPLRGDA